MTTLFVLLPALYTLAIVSLALLIGATAYESIVIAPNFEREIPGSITAARQFLQRTPAAYFRPVAPFAQLLLLACVVASWPTPSFRWPALIALVAAVVTDVVTFTYQYPRVAVMFRRDASADDASLRRVAREWAIGNWIRAGLLLLALLATIHAFGQVWATIGRERIARAAETRNQMTANQKTVEAYMEGFRTTDRPAILSCLTDDVEWVIPGAFHVRGKDDFAKHIVDPGFAGHPVITVHRMIENNDVVVAEGSVKAPREDGTFMDLVFCDVFDMRDGKIRRLISYLMEDKPNGS